MTTDVTFAPNKSRAVSRGVSLRPLTYLPGTSVEKKLRGPCHLLLSWSYCHGVTYFKLGPNSRHLACAQKQITTHYQTDPIMAINTINQICLISPMNFVFVTNLKKNSLQTRNFSMLFQQRMMQQCNICTPQIY